MARLTVESELLMTATLPLSFNTLARVSGSCFLALRSLRRGGLGARERQP
jgi:hypothetical protein